jgi:hypothetical protein
MRRIKIEIYLNLDCSNPAKSATIGKKYWAIHD